jgi:hypothetical protein
MESFSHRIKIPVYDKAMNFLQKGLYVFIVWHLIFVFYCMGKAFLSN